VSGIERGLRDPVIAVLQELVASINVPDAALVGRHAHKGGGT